jgi:4-hydroxyphenylpyruvate dioxygenase
MKEWADFYERLFNFREIRYFDIEGTGHRAQEQGDDQPLRQDPHPDQREGSDDKGQIQEYLDLYHGEGIQHIALATGDIFATVQAMQAPAWCSRTRPTPTTN